MRANQSQSVWGSLVVLVPYAAEHVPAYHAWMADEEIRLATASEPLTLEEEYQMQRSWAEDEDKCTFIVLARSDVEAQAAKDSSSPYHLSESGMVGDVNLFFTSADSDGEPTAEVEVMIAEWSWRGKGLGAEAVALMLRYATEQLGRTRFQAKIGVENSASLRLFRERLGFATEGVSEAFAEPTLRLDAPLPHAVRHAAEGYQLRSLCSSLATSKN